jgi:hypothetical protein
MAIRTRRIAVLTEYIRSGRNTVTVVLPVSRFRNVRDCGALFRRSILSTIAFLVSARQERRYGAIPVLCKNSIWLKSLG